MVRLWCLLGLSAAILQSATTADDLIRQVEARYNGAHTLSLAFVENYSIAGHPRPSEEGRLTLRKERKMRWDYTKPAGKLFISDGKSVFLYTAGENRVEKVPLKSTEDMRAPLAFLLGRLELKKEFRSFGVHSGEGGTWLEATSKSERTPYEKIAMLVAGGGTVKELKVTGRDQSLIEFSFRDEQLNAPADDSLFHFKIPAGAEIVDSVDFGGER